MPTLSTAQTFDSIILHLCIFKYNLTVNYTNVFNPQYTLDRLGLKKGNGEKNWEYIANDCRYLMEHAFGFRMWNVPYKVKQDAEIACSDLS